MFYKAAVHMGEKFQIAVDDIILMILFYIYGRHLDSKTVADLEKKEVQFFFIGTVMIVSSVAFYQSIAWLVLPYVFMLIILLEKKPIKDYYTEKIPLSNTIIISLLGIFSFGLYVLSQNRTTDALSLIVFSTGFTLIMFSSYYLNRIILRANGG